MATRRNPLENWGSRKGRCGHRHDAQLQVRLYQLPGQLQRYRQDLQPSSRGFSNGLQTVQLLYYSLRSTRTARSGSCIKGRHRPGCTYFVNHENSSIFEQVPSVQVRRVPYD